MTLVCIGCKHNLTYINNYLRSAFLCAPSRQTHDWLYTEFYRRRWAYAVRQWIDASHGTPYMQESSSNISSRKQSISNQKGNDETRVLTLRTWCIRNFPAPQDIRISMRCLVINVSITHAFPPESRETPVQHKSFKYNMTYGKIAPHFANHSASMIQF